MILHISPQKSAEKDTVYVGGKDSIQSQLFWYHDKKSKTVGNKSMEVS